MANSFFDDVFDNKIIFEKEKLFKQTQEVLKDEDYLDETRLTNDEIENLLSETRSIENKVFTKREAYKIEKSLLESKKDLGNLLDLIRSEKDFYSSVIKKSPKNYDIDISKNTKMKRFRSLVFGGNSNKITYEDYLTLLEMKRIIDLKEKEDMLNEGVYK